MFQPQHGFILAEPAFPILGIGWGETLPVPMTEAFLKALLKKLRCARGCDETGSHGKYSPDCTPVQFGGERRVPSKMPNRDQY